MKKAEIILYVIQLSTIYFNNSNYLYIFADTVVIAGISIGLQVLVAIIIILFILLVSFFFYRKHKNRLYLCCRDLCKPANATGK